MVNVILSPKFDSDAILDKVKQNFKKGSKHIIIVPDNFTLAYEKATLEYLDTPGAFDLVITNFDSLANQYLGKAANRILDKQSSVMLLRKIIEDNKSELRCFKGATNLIGFAEEMYQAIMRIRESGVDADKLIEVADDDDKLTIKLKNKTHDIALLYKKYVDVIQEGNIGIDGISKLKLFSKIIPDSDLSDYHIYISDYTDFTKSMYEVMQQMMSTALSFNINILSSTAANRYIYVDKIKDNIISLAEQAGEKIEFSTYMPLLNSDMYKIQENLFSYEKVDFPNNDGHVKIYEASSIENEVKHVARQINQLIKEGHRYKDISIVCCDLPAYEDTIKKVFKDFDISYYCDLKSELLNQSITNAILSAISIVWGNFRQQDIRSFVKQPILGLDYIEVCDFENFIIEYGIDYRKFMEPFEKKDIMDENYYNVAENIRSKICKMVEPLRVEINTISDAVAAVKRFLSKNKMQEANDKLAEKQAENGFIAESKITAQCYDLIMNILDQANAMMGETGSTLRKFYYIFQSVVSSTKISGIPIYVDNIFIGEEGNSKYEKSQYLFVIGATEGKFPTLSSDAGIIADREIEAWKKCNIDIEPDTRARNRQLKLNTLLTILTCQNKLIISYSNVDATYQKQNHSETIDYLLNICNEKIRVVKEPNDEWQLEDFYRYISVQNNILNEFLTLSRKIEDDNLQFSGNTKKIINILYDYVCNKYGKEIIDNILDGGADFEDKITTEHNFVWNHDNTSPSQIEKYFNCPFKHFMDYFLRVQKRAKANLEVSDIGTILHAIMEKYFSQTDCCDIDNEKIKKRVLRYFEEVKEENVKLQIMMSQDNAKAIKEDICFRANFIIKNLVVKMQCTKFRPVMCEQKFGYSGENSYAPVRIQATNRVLNIKGVIDRVDKIKDDLDKRFFVIDYKSKGSIDFTIRNIYFGDRVQLVIYLMALLNSGNLTPAGMFYMLMPDKFEEKDSAKEKDRYKFEGYVDVNQETLPDVDKHLENKSESELFDIKLSAKGELSGSILNEEQFMAAINYVKKLIGKAVDEIDDGYIAPRPLEGSTSACRFCDYKTICKIAEKANNKRVLAKDKDIVDEMLGVKDERI